MTLTQSKPSGTGYWRAGEAKPETGVAALDRALGHLEAPFIVVETDTGLGIATGGEVEGAAAGVDEGRDDPDRGLYPIRAYVGAGRLESLGDPSFCADHGLRYPYVAGAMANGLSPEPLVEAMARAGMLGFFGAAGLPPDRVEAAIDRIQESLRTDEGHLPFGFNLINSPAEPSLEAAIVDLYLRRGVRLVSASAYLRLTLPIVRYRVQGIHLGPDGGVIAPNRVIAKVSRIEVAERFFSPPPAKLLAKLIESGEITPEQAELARRIPMAQDLTAEADSGGHTDNRPFMTMLPTMLALRDRMQEKFGYTERLRVGAAGGIGTPASAAAAFAMGAAYVLTGSINQSCVESGTSAVVREMLCAARQADVTMAPAADMFEMGVKVQVLKRGTMFAMRASKLYEHFRAYGSIEEIPADVREALERDVFQASLDDIWAETRRFFAERDPRQIERAESEPKHRMALVFRWYLGMSSHWANAGVPERKIDYQIWCGPAMAAFNEWVKGSCLEAAEERTVQTLALNLLAGAARLLRVQSLRSQGVGLPPEIARAIPRPLIELKERLNLL